MSELTKQQNAAKKLDDMFSGIPERKTAAVFADDRRVMKNRIKRIGEDEGLAEDVLKKQKTWDQCFKYIYEKARKMAGGQKAAAIIDETVFEWAEDYYRGTDKDVDKARESSRKASKVANEA